VTYSEKYRSIRIMPVQHQITSIAKLDGPTPELRLHPFYSRTRLRMVFKESHPIPDRRHRLAGGIRIFVLQECV